MPSRTASTEIPARQAAAASPGPIGQAVVTGNGINYHNGPVMKGNPVHAYIIWYGNWNSTGSNTAATRSLIEHFLGTIGGSNIEKVNTTYGDTTGNVSGNVSFAGSTIVSSTTNLSDAGVQTQVSNALNSGALPARRQWRVFVLTSSNINETSGFCTQYCGWHTHATLGGVGHQVFLRRQRGPLPQRLRNPAHRPQQPGGERRRRGRHGQRDFARTGRSHLRS